MVHHVRRDHTNYSYYYFWDDDGFDMENWEDWGYFVRVSIVIEKSSRSSDAFIATFDFTNICFFGCLTSTTLPTFSAPTTFLTHYIGYIDTTSIPTSGPSSRYSSSRAPSPSSTMSETFFKFRHTPEQSFWDFLSHRFLDHLVHRPLQNPVPS